MITKAQKDEIVKKFGKHEKDCGSAAVQVAMLTTRINYLQQHFKKHIHDFHSNRGLLKMIGKRKSFLKYIAKNSFEEYSGLIKELGLRK